MTRVIHTADTHLGYRQYHRPERRTDFLAAFRRVLEDAVEMDVDAVIHAGDLFHDRRPDLEDVLGALSALRDLDAAGIPFLAVVGNHEGKRDAQWLDLFATLGLATRLGRDPVVFGNVAVYGLDFVPRSRREDLSYEFVPPGDGRDVDTGDGPATDYAVLVAHGQFAPLVPDYGGRTDPWDARSVLEESTVGFDALLLGDEHTPCRERLEDGTVLTYPGSTERVSADERADRGYNIVEFEDGAGGPPGVHISRRGIPTREFVFVDVELADGEGVDRVNERVGQHDLADAVVVVSIESEGDGDGEGSGEGEGEGEAVAPADVEEHVRDAGALVARVTDRREATGTDDVEVSFADPDEAVRERVRELGLSAAARDIDETIRSGSVAKTNVADAVEERVRELVETGDPAPFEAADAPTETGDGEESSASTGGSPGADSDEQVSMEEYL